MNDKCTTKNPISQTHRLPAGILPGDYATELFGDCQTRKVYGKCNGQTIPFSQINPVLKATIFELMLADENAMADLWHMEQEAALEEYAFCMFGALDHNADFTHNGQPGKPENFMCSTDCRCIKWKNKAITLNGHKLTPRQIQMANYLATDNPDKAIASALKITRSTLDTNKRKMYAKAGVQSKAGFTRVALNHKAVV